MKIQKRFLALALVIILALTLSPMAFAASGANGFGKLPAGVYTYVGTAPKAEAGSAAGQIQFLWDDNSIVWAYGAEGAAKTGTEVLSGDELEFFKGMYISDRPVTDWVGGGLKDVEGYAGEVAGNVQLTITENDKISKIQITNAKTRVLAIVSSDITDSTLTIHGITRGRPNLLQSCITMMGSTNGLYLTKQGDVVLDNVTIGHGADGVGLRGDKIGGDTFVVGTVSVDGTVEWNNKMGVILPLDSQPGTLVTNGYDITMTGGSNIGRVGRTLNISTGEGGGNITIGATVSTDSTRGGISPTADTSNDGVTLNTSGSITAGKGDVVIGTNTEKAVIVDLIGKIQGNNVTVKPDNRGKVGNVTGAIGSIEAAGNIDVKIGTVNSGSADANTNATQGFTVWSADGTTSCVIGDMISESGNITLEAGVVSGSIGSITAAKGTVIVNVESADSVGSVTGATVNKNIASVGVAFKPTASGVAVDGKTVAFDAYNIKDNNYFKLRDLASVLSGTGKQFEVSFDASKNAIVITSGAAYTKVGGEMEKGSVTDKLATVSASKIVLDGKELNLTAYNIGGNNFFKLRDLGSALNFGIEWDAASNMVKIDTSAAYAA